MMNMNMKIGSDSPVFDSLELMFSKKGESVRRPLTISIHQPVLIKDQPGIDPLWVNQWICVTTLDAICDGIGIYGPTPDKAMNGGTDFFCLLSGMRQNYDFYSLDSDEPMERFIEFMSDWILDN